MISSIISRVVIISRLLKYFVNSLLTPVYWITHRKVRDNRLKQASSDSGKDHSIQFTSGINNNTWNFISVFNYAAIWDNMADETAPVDEEDIRNCELKQPSKEDHHQSVAMSNPISALANLSISKFLIIVGLIGGFLNKTFIYTVVYPAFRLVFGTLYPAYASYKAVKTKNVKEYVKWMMYWIVFALFTCTETFTDIFLSWFPFYYEIKIILVIWLLSPATKGSSILYRKFVHPMLSSREQEIDDYISKAKEQSYRQVLDLGQKGVTVLMQTAIKSGGGIVNQLKKSYSLGDLSDPTNDGNDETDDVLVTDPRLIRRRKPGRSPHRSSSASASVYFSEVDVVAAGSIINERISEVRSVEDISSGYSSGEGLYAAHQPLKLQGRDSIASQRANSLTRSRSTRVTRSGVPKKSGVASDDSDENDEVFDTNIIFLNDKVKKIDKLIEKHESSSSEAEFFDIPENNGFQLHGSERSSSNNTKVIELVKYNPQYGSASANPRDFRYDNDIEITACKSDLFLPSSSSLLNFNLSKLSAALSSLYYSSLARSQIDTATNQSNKAEVLQDARNEPLHMEAQPCYNSSTIEKTVVQIKSDERGGKYNKKLAPLPPISSKKENHTANPIKAKLVLQPGVVRSLSSSAESLTNKEIFVNYPAKLKRKTVRSSSPNKAESPLLKMLRLPKKMAHLNIPGRAKEKRHSWGEFFHTKKLVDGKIQSKSASNLDTIAEPEGAKPFQRGGSQISIRSLTESPLGHRRLKVVRTCAADKDTD